MHQINLIIYKSRNPYLLNKISSIILLVEKIGNINYYKLIVFFSRYENHPLKVGAAFLRHESKFYLYALYNKNKPKSDSLMSEYGTTFFKVCSIIFYNLHIIV